MARGQAMLSSMEVDGPSRWPPTSVKFEIVEELLGSVCIMRLKSRVVDIEGSATLRQALTDSMGRVSESGAMILQMESVAQICSLALTVFVEAYRQCTARHVPFAMCALRPELVRIFHETRLDTILTIFPTESDALTRLASGGESA